MDVPTRLSDVGIESTEINDIISKLKEHGMVKLGENRDITPDVSHQILEAAL